MLRPLTVPTTPLRGVVRVDGEYANYSAPTQTWVNTVPLLPPALPEILSQMSLRRTSAMRQRMTPHRLTQSSPALRETSRIRSAISSRKHTPTRKISDHLTIRRRRRSSSGVPYESAFSGTLNKDFLRLFSRTLVKEKKQLIEEPDDQVYRALDKQYMIASVSPQGPVRDFDLSLPLPLSDGEMDSCEEIPSPVHSHEKDPKIIPENSKPVFKSYLEQILESRLKKPMQKFDLMFDKESSEEAARPDKLKNMINTSKFIIENTLSGLPEASFDTHPMESFMKLAEPVAFGLLHDDASSNESSEKENLTSNMEGPFRSIRLPQIGLGNKTPESYDIKFDNIDQLDVPSWDPVPIYNDSDTLHLSIANVNASDPDSELSHTEIVLGHYTVDNNDIITDQPSFDAVNSDFASHVTPSPHTSPIRIQAMNSRSNLSRNLNLPKNLVKGLVSVAQHLPLKALSRSPPRKKQKLRRVKPDVINLLSQKSNEFLLHVMQDLTDYAVHRSSDQINISDALLFVNRINSRHKLLGEEIEFPKLAQNVFPLELLMSLDNSLQESVETTLRKRSKNPENLTPKE
ncbi:hypothetical protein METBIDRAFT_44587 [Metschnikowia bicuspidata var. bicuspidata NRRL YB-4993]|uniref:CENP-T/Histone H4 histone fold domain-containing protein n=1 Tax=Metschnikowia bicuspidata var. bicuspidata NRRL YB-4993 TaxID=869754 RepID=A0A1A0H7X1_9ASCO|nr:hypothetical protein METBIDRAFT_44587 [Metschnikowia bicuspidata var. bicuspidata NRRL YB-4993]OBA20121.1 hypothetical protein METBIDRAFT_44587 [Metschnikowia bicuspidata var. bicuspidata NRRL YB-4993]